MRELAWMAQGRRVDEWDRVAATLAFIARQLAGAKVDPLALNPYRAVEPPPPVSAERRKRESEQAWALLDRVWGPKAKTVYVVPAGGS